VPGSLTLMWIKVLGTYRAIFGA